MREATITMAEMAPAERCSVAMAGADVTDQPDVHLAAGADIGLLGEGEHAAVEVVDRWLGRSAATAPIAGSATLVDGRGAQRPTPDRAS